MSGTAARLRDRFRGERRIARDNGESLIQLTIAIVIMGVLVVAVGACITFSVKASGIHRNQALADQYLHDYAEQLQSDYRPCSGTPSSTGSAYLGDLTVGVPATFNSPTVSIAFWSGGASPQFGPLNPAACPGTDPGLQQLTLTLTSKDLRVADSVVVVVRKATSP